MIRSDEVWFVEKDKDGASRLVSLAEYKPRENVQKGYLQGRYSAIPFFAPIETLNWQKHGKRKDFVRLEGVRSARLVVIASEGRCTESIYFSAVKDRLRAPNVHVEILARDSNESSPESVHAQIADFMRQYNIEDDDELWLVIDRDRWHERMLSQVAQLCAQNPHLNFCMSNPCFELWLLLHLEDIRGVRRSDFK